ncbi:hypothetical protein T4E_8295 [Trichinella pseudospiralis]|uniref:Uncharacterized protein n=1 Tax=Trichinella pseudospiralis TaxID=6337 RepID=A0A0V0YMZ6_TRIPS|nr:hypothetical protein T4E_8295 [Trichinella pseudospiralis]
MQGKNDSKKTENLEPVKEKNQAKRPMQLIGVELQRMSGTAHFQIIGRIDKRPSFAPAKPALVKWHRSRPVLERLMHARF